MIWPFKKRENESSEARSKIENPRLKSALANHEKVMSKESHLKLLQELNTSKYLIAMQDDEVKFTINKETGFRTVDPSSKYKFLLASSPDNLPLLALFTDNIELESWAQKSASASWVMSAQEAWEFALGMSLGIIVNPSSAGWIMGKEHIEWLKEHPLKGA